MGFPSSALVSWDDSVIILAKLIQSPSSASALEVELCNFNLARLFVATWRTSSWVGRRSWIWDGWLAQVWDSVLSTITEVGSFSRGRPASPTI